MSADVERERPKASKAVMPMVTRTHDDALVVTFHPPHWNLTVSCDVDGSRTRTESRGDETSLVTGRGDV